MPGNRRIWVWIWVWLWPLAVLAQAPPPEFRGALFIDAEGCVRERAGYDWHPRLLPDGAPDCGYPPTPLPPAPPRASELPLPPGMPEAEARLLTTMAEGLRPGDFLASLPAPDPPPVRHPALDAITAAASAEGVAVRSVVADGRPNARLCALLGQDEGVARLGSDPSRGFCPGDGPLPITAAWRPAARMPATGRGDASADRIDRPADAGAPDAVLSMAMPGHAPLPKPAGQPAPASAASPAPVGGSRVAVTSPPSRTAVAPAAVAAPSATPPRRAIAAPGAAILPAHAATDAGGGAAMIPAGARYLELAVRADPVAAQAVFDQVAGLGLPMARGRIRGGDGILVMAGPFDSREAIVRAHARLRAAGFVGMVPR